MVMVAVTVKMGVVVYVWRMRRPVRLMSTVRMLARRILLLIVLTFVAKMPLVVSRRRTQCFGEVIH